VVASGQFLIDSEASLRSTERRMAPDAAPAPDKSARGQAPAGAQSSPSHRAEGRLERIGHHDVTISHGPVPSLKWGAMTMDFNAPKAGIPPELKAGDAIVFEFVQSAQGTYDITKIERKAGKP